MTNYRLFVSALLFALALVPLACGSNKVRVYPVRGEVYYKGKPAAGAIIHLHPRDKAKCPPAFATAESDGSFQMTTYAANDGAAVGEYAVTVISRDEKQVDGETTYSADKFRNRYSKADTSGLQATIKAKRNELPRFELK